MMLRTRVFPCLLLKNDTLVKTINFKQPLYIGDPINTVVIYNEKEVDELAFLDISATLENRRPRFDVIEKIASECFMPFAYGGGIKTIADMKKIFNLGAEKVVLNSVFIENPTLVKKAASIFGNQSIVVSIDARRNGNSYDTYTRSGTKPTNLGVVELAKKAVELGAGEIFLNSIDRDGTMRGYDVELINCVSKCVDVPVVACGGAGSYADIGIAKEAGASAVAAGSIFVYQGKNRSVLINFPTQAELKQILKE